MGIIDDVLGGGVVDAAEENIGLTDDMARTLEAQFTQDLASSRERTQEDIQRTGASLDSALADINRGYNSSIARTDAGYNRAITDIDQTGRWGTSRLEQGYDLAIGEGRQIFDRSREAIGESTSKGIAALDAGRERSNASYMDAIGSLQPLIDQATSSRNMISNMLGLTGGAGGETIQEMFDATPGQQFLMAQSEQAIRRGSAASGTLESGRYAEALQENAMGLSDQFFSNYINQLETFSAPGVEAMGMRAGLYENQANQGQEYDMAASDLYGREGSTLGILGADEARNLTGLRSGQADSLAELAIGVGSARTQAGLDYTSDLNDLRISQGQQAANIAVTRANSITQLNQQQAGRELNLGQNYLANLGAITSARSQANLNVGTAEEAQAESTINMGTAVLGGVLGGVAGGFTDSGWDWEGAARGALGGSGILSGGA